MVDYKILWLKMMSVPESRAVVGRHDGINGRDRGAKMNPAQPKHAEIPEHGPSIAFALR